MSTTSVSSSKNERAGSDLPMEVEAARSLNKYLRTYLSHIQRTKRAIQQFDANLQELRRRQEDRLNVYVKRRPG